MTNGSVVVPVWLAPMALTTFIVLGLSYVVGLSADDAQARVDAHKTILQLRFEKLEASDKTQDTNVLLIRQEITHLSQEVAKAAISTERNNRLLNRIANKLDVEMD
tara:strand:- start:515 stop:832 length:318 start_codon:yes stop_codon:yes gene_type:complete